MKLKLRYTVILIILVGCSSSYANTIISGQIFNCNKTITAEYLLPFGEFYNQFYDNKEIKIGGNHSFRIDLKLDSSGFIILDFPGMRYYLFVQSGDQINLKLYYSQNQKKEWFVNRTLYSGSNSAGHRIFNSYGPFLHSMDLIKKEIFGARKYSSYTQLYDKSVFLTDSLLQPFKLLLESNKISNKYYTHISTEIKVSFSILVLTIFNYYAHQTPVDMAMNKDEREKAPYFMNQELFNDSNYIHLEQLFYQSISPNEPAILSTSMGVLYLNLYYTDLLNQIIPNTRKEFYDSTFNNMDGDSRYLGYLRGEALEMSWADALHWEATSDTSNDRLMRSYSLFSHEFPNSGFLGGLSERLGVNMSENSFDSLRTIHLNVIKGDKYETLNDLIAANFKNEYVFIDLWATWCVPCIEQFTFKNKLEEFLDKEGITILYISIDSKSNEHKWKSFIQFKKLNGSHYLVDDDMLANIKSVVYKNGPITIPRYLMVNKNGRLVSTNLPRPSDFNLLEAEIERLKAK